MHWGLAVHCRLLKGKVYANFDSWNLAKTGTSSGSSWIYIGPLVGFKGIPLIHLSRDTKEHPNYPLILA